jgi:citrate lyase subunit beta / citryl-CoA lyase
MRSLLIAAAQEERLAAALLSGADAVTVDLAQAAPAEMTAARTLAARFLKETPRRAGGPRLIVRVNPLDSGETDSDLDAVMAHAPDAILLPRSLGAASVQQLSAKLAVREAEFALDDGSTRIIALADVARSLFGMGSYRGSSARLSAIAWSVEELRNDIGAETDRDPSGAYTGPYRLARDLTLIAAASAGVAAIDTGFADLHNEEGLRAEALAARRDGFAGKIAVDPAQAAVINGAFPLRPTPLGVRNP